MITPVSVVVPTVVKLDHVVDVTASVQRFNVDIKVGVYGCGLHSIVVGRSLGTRKFVKR